MTEQQHPITPPPELVEQWRNAAPPLGLNRESWIATAAACWGADQELEACVKWIEDCGYHPSVAEDIRDARRPKPPSLKELALDALTHILNHSSTELGANTIRRALNQLPND